MYSHYHSNLLALLALLDGQVEVTTAHYQQVLKLASECSIPPWDESRYEPDDPDEPEDHEAVRALRFKAEKTMKNNGFDIIKSWMSSMSCTHVVKTEPTDDALCQLLVIGADGQPSRDVYDAIMEVMEVLASFVNKNEACACSIDYASFLCEMVVAFANPQEQGDWLTETVLDELWWAHYMLTQEDLEILREFGKKNSTNLCGEIVSDLFQHMDWANTR